MTRSLVDTVVVGFDGSAGGAHALQWAAQDARLRGLRLHVIHVWQPPPILHPGFPSPAMPDTKGILDEALTRVSAVAPELRVRMESLPGPVALALVDASTEADSIVVGARGRRRRGRDFGSTAWQVATHALCPVVVVPDGETATDEGLDPDVAQHRPVVVGVDGSHESDNALRYAFGRAERTDVEVVAVHAWSVDDPAEVRLGQAWGGQQAEWAAQQSTSLDDWLAPHVDRHPDVKVRRVSVHRHPVQALVDESRDAAIVAVGNRGRGGFRGLLLGSVGMELLHEAPCPVAVVRY